VRRNAIHLTNVNELRTLPAERIARSIVADAKAHVVFDGESAADVTAAIDVARRLEKEHGKRLLYQAGTTMAALLSGRPASAALPASDIRTAFPHIARPGLTVVGSLTDRTRNQVSHLRLALMDKIVEVIFDHRSLGDPSQRARQLEATCSRIRSHLAEDKEVMLLSGFWIDTQIQRYPSRSDRNVVLDFFSDVVKRFYSGKKSDAPGWITFKGSDTAYKCLSRALDVRGFDYLGPIVPGALLCKIADGANPSHETPLVLFAGNSGGKNDLFELSRKMQLARRAV
jgi:uncharacterized protein YgbK (DUF1537 family)